MKHFPCPGKLGKKNHNKICGSKVNNLLKNIQLSLSVYVQPKMIKKKKVEIKRKRNWKNDKMLDTTRTNKFVQRSVENVNEGGAVLSFLLTKPIIFFKYKTQKWK